MIFIRRRPHTLHTLFQTRRSRRYLYKRTEFHIVYCYLFLIYPFSSSDGFIIIIYLYVYCGAVSAEKGRPEGVGRIDPRRSQRKHTG